MENHDSHNFTFYLLWPYYLVPVQWKWTEWLIPNGFMIYELFCNLATECTSGDGLFKQHFLLFQQIPKSGCFSCVIKVNVCGQAEIQLD